jgi:3',5'-cyclic AMP phosphodiesterase CpdA
MKKNALVYLFCILCVVFTNSCKSDDNAKAVPETVKFMVISDIHYFDPSLFTLPVNASFLSYLAADRKLIIESSAILKNVLAAVMAEKPDFLLVTGDLTKDGEKVDHQAVAALFKTLSDNGIKVLVIPGNHDVNNPSAYSYTGATQTSIANVSATDFASIYGNCGYGNAVERDPNSLSYVSEPINGVWVMGIDACHYAPASETAGSMSATTLAWVKSIITKSKKQNKILLSMMHHGMLEHFAGQATLFSEYVIADWKNVSTALADSGMNVVFTGHFHAQDIAKSTGTKGFIYDIETGSTVTAPCPYRTITLNTVNKTLKIVSSKIDGVTYSTIPTGTSFQAYAKNYLSSGMKTVSYYMLSGAPYNIPASYITSLKLDSIFSNAFIAHYAGDETPSASDNVNIQTVNQAIPSLGAAIQSVWTDPAPKDNNITIDLKTGVATAN